MRVRDLKKKLEKYNDNDVVLFDDGGSDYLYTLKTVRPRKDTNGFVILTWDVETVWVFGNNGQLGKE